MTDLEHVPYGEGVDLARDLLARAPLATLVLTADSRIRFVNRPCEELFGYTREEIAGAPYTALFPERLRGPLTERLDAYFAEEDPQPLAFRPDFTGRRKDGSEFPLQYVATPLRNRHGLWVVVTIFDVTAERAQVARIESLKRAYLTLARMNEAVARASDAASLYDDTCRVAVEEGGFLGAWVGHPGPGGRVRPVAVAGPLEDYIEALDIRTDASTPTGRGPTAVALRERRTVYSRDFASDPDTAPWHATAAAHGIQSSVCLPLRCGGRVVAVLSLYADRSGVFDEETGTLLEGLAQNVSFALDSFESAERLERVAAQRRELLRRLVTAQESERQRIAGDIHDESIQSLAAVELRLGLAERRARELDPELGEMLATVREVVATATESLRELMFDLELPESHDGLAMTLRATAEHVFLDSPVQWHVDVDEVPLSRVQLGQALRITKEALINVRKHARADNVRVTARTQAGGARFQVTDDGAGFDESSDLAARGHRGLQTMQERAELSGGWFRVEHPAAGGSQVAFWLPYEGRDA